MTVKKRYAKTFYTRRDLPTPRQEIWPADTGELRDVLLDAKHDIPLLVLGDGQHVRPAVIGERTFDVVRTEGCKRVLSVDRESKIVRVECGLRWSDLHEELRDRGLTMERYGLVPASSTVGGLLSRHHGTGRQMWDGDLRGGCIAVSGTTPGTGDYGYLAAPRKASGPDMRYLFVGGEGLLGVILDASLVAWRPSEARLFSWETGPIHALEIHRRLLDMGVAPAWSCYVGKTLHVAVFGPDGLLRALERELGAFSPTHTGGRDDVSAMRTKLEADHPGRRESPTANRTHAATFSVAQLGAAFDALDDAELTIFDLNRHTATVYATYPKGKAPAELPGAIAHLPHASSLVASDEKIHWSHWSQTLKSELDRNRRLAVGP